MPVEEYEFRIRLALTGEVFGVPSDKSIVEVLRENGIDIETCCEQGYCGTCMTRYLEGEPEHRDEALDDEDREDYVLNLLRPLPDRGAGARPVAQSAWRRTGKRHRGVHGTGIRRLPWKSAAEDRVSRDACATLDVSPGAVHRTERSPQDP